MNGTTEVNDRGMGQSAGVNPIISARHLEKIYTTGPRWHRRQVPAVQGVDLDVFPGETLAIVGESGAGKSTVGRMLLRLIEPDSGSLTFEGRDLLGLSRRELRQTRRHMQMVFQDPYSSLDPTKSVAHALEEPLKIHGLGDASERHRRVNELLARVGLRQEFGNRFPRELSGGQLQRIAISRAIASNPRLVICDEPVAALDLSVQGQVLNLLLDLQEERELAYAFISHDLSVVRGFSHRVAVMYSGRVVEIGSTRAIYEAPQHPYTRALLAAMPGHGKDHSSISKQAAAERLPLTAVGEGCAYRNRCAFAMDVCHNETPQLTIRAGGSKAACHLDAEEADDSKPVADRTATDSPPAKVTAQPTV